MGQESYSYREDCEQNALQRLLKRDEGFLAQVAELLDENPAVLKQAMQES